MQPSLEKLRKFFRLEHENKYQNTSIIGGLAKMLDYWEGEARADGIREDVIQAVAQRVRSYDGLSPESRADVLKGLWKRIAETYPEAAQKPGNGGLPAGSAETSQTVRLPRPAAESAPTTPLSLDNKPPSPPGQGRETPRGGQGPRPGGGRPHPSAPSRADRAPGGRHSQTPAALN